MQKPGTQNSYWFTSEDYDYFTVAGKTYNLLCEIPSEPFEEYKLDKQGPTLSGGALVRFDGRDLCTFTVQFKLFNDDHFLEWRDQLRPALKSQIKMEKGDIPSGAKPLQVYHPVLADANVGAAYVKKIGGIKRSEPGLFTVDVEFMEYRPPRPFKQSVTPDGPLRDKDRVPTGAGTKYDQQAESLSAVASGLGPLGG
jgi:hypothetical protein